MALIVDLHRFKVLKCKGEKIARLEFRDILVLLKQSHGLLLPPQTSYFLKDRQRTSDSFKPKAEENTDEQDDDLDIQYQDWLDDELPDFNDDDNEN
ncbi:hypothetical protein EVAR_70279_1 [Eumeta japonica]|uniref:Uncharacterized protein n=1 Tax=Eumeta variegata TaxID=151549 RepID=A0A4C2A035_EUMVA|nr:hypothetical protein EVAR_70279_1 [Eumeta japonica]